MHDDQVDVDPELVRRLLTRQCPERAALPLARVGDSGTDHALFRLGDELVVRLPIREDANGQAELETRWLGPIAPALPLAVSVPVFLGRPDEGYPFRWSVNPWLEGERLDPTAVDREQLAVDLAAFVRALQSCDTEGAGLFGSRGQPLDEPGRDLRTRESLAAAADLVDVPAALAVWEQAREAPAWDRPPAWFHGDLTASNLLVRDGRISAVLDWGPWGAGDPSVDLHSAYQLFDADSRAVFREAVAMDDAAWTRGRGWAISIAAMEIPYYRQTRPEFTARSVRAIEQVLAE